MNVVDKFKGYKTVAFNVVVAVVAVVGTPELVEAVKSVGVSSDQVIAAVTAAVAAVNVVLRLVTNSPAFKKV